MLRVGGGSGAAVSWGQHEFRRTVAVHAELVLLSGDEVLVDAVLAAVPVAQGSEYRVIGLNGCESDSRGASPGSAREVGERQVAGTTAEGDLVVIRLRLGGGRGGVSRRARRRRHLFHIVLGSGSMNVRARRRCHLCCVVVFVVESQTCVLVERL
eukprot:7303506-Prymnesium_polylepis.1